MMGATQTQLNTIDTRILTGRISQAEGTIKAHQIRIKKLEDLVETVLQKLAQKEKKTKLPPSPPSPPAKRLIREGVGIGK